MTRPLSALVATGIAAAVLAAPMARSQTLLGVKVEPAQARVGEPVTVSAQFDLSKAQNCHVRIHFGDGQTTDAKINQEKDANLVVPYTYRAAGHYTVMVEPKTALPLLKCSGPNQKAVVAIAAAPPAPKPAASAGSAAAAAASAPGPACPAGWTLVARSVNRKTGAFACSARPGTAAPADKPACPGTLKYHENTKKGQLGCRP